MNGQNFSNMLCRQITELRKKNNLTQEALADKLGVTFQAVSKWENNNSCPDIALLPQLAEIFGVSMDELFGITVKNESCTIENVPWKDDGKLRAVIFKGKTLMKEPIEEAQKFTFEYKGEALNIEAHMSLVCGDVEGDVSAKGSVKCGDVEGDVSCNGSVTCCDVGGEVSANGSITCASVEGDISANGAITCADVEGNIQTSGSVICASVEGDVTANILRCREISGEVHVKKIEDYDAK